MSVLRWLRRRQDYQADEPSQVVLDLSKLPQSVAGYGPMVRELSAASIEVASTVLDAGVEKLAELRAKDDVANYVVARKELIIRLHQLFVSVSTDAGVAAQGDVVQGKGVKPQIKR